MDFSFAEFAIIGIVALLVIGPDKLPGLARTAGLWVGKVRGFINSVKTEIDAELKLEGLKDSVNDSKNSFHEITEIIKDTRSEFQNSINSIKSPDYGDSETDSETSPNYQVKAIADEVDDEDDAQHNEVEEDFVDDYNSDYEIAEIDPVNEAEAAQDSNLNADINSDLNVAAEQKTESGIPEPHSQENVSQARVEDKNKEDLKS